MFASPNVILPNAVIFPVACKFPVTFRLLKTSTVPVPFGLNSISALESLEEITFPSMSILSILALF